MGLVAPWHLPGPGIKPESPTLSGRCSTTGPPGESQLVVFLIISISQFVFLFLPLFFCVLWDYSAFLASLIKSLVTPSPLPSLFSNKLLKLKKKNKFKDRIKSKKPPNLSS